MLVSIYTSLFVLLSSLLTYTNNTYKYSVKYPSDWSQMEKSGAIFFKSPLEPGDKFDENVNVMIQDLSSQPSMTLEQYTDLTKGQLTQIKATGIILKDVTFAAQKAKEIVYSAPMQGFNLKFKQVWFIKNKKAYLVTYTAEMSTFSKYEKTAGEIMNSFKLQ